MRYTTHILLCCSLFIIQFQVLAETHLDQTYFSQNIVQQKTFTTNSSQPHIQKQEIKKYLKDNNIDETKVRILSQNRCQPLLLENEIPNKKNLKKRKHPRQATDDTNPNIGGSFNFSSGGSDEFAVILLVVIGTVVIISWLASFPALLFKGINDKECILLKQQFFAETHSYNFSNYYQNGSSYAFQYSIYFKHMFDNSIYYGLNFLLGRHKIDYGLGFETATSEDEYYLIGPSLLLPFYSATSKNNQYGMALNLDFLLGSSLSDDIEGMTQARLGLQYSNPNHFLFGFGIAGNKLNIKTNQGYFKDNNDFSLSYYFKFGLEF